MNDLQFLCEYKDNLKLFEYTLLYGELIACKIYYPSGRILNEVQLKDGKIESYRIYQDFEKKLESNVNVGYEWYTKPLLDYTLIPNLEGRIEKCLKYDLLTHTVIYEGNFFNRSRYGIGTEYSKEGKIVYHGQWMNDLYNGKGTFYHPNGKVMFEGEFADGKRQGQGTEYDKLGEKFYMGLWKEDQKGYKGTYFYANGQPKYSGDILEDKKHGMGIQFYENGNVVYQGQFMKDKFFGKGKFCNMDGSVFMEGDFCEEKFCGKKYNNENKIVYTGQQIKPPGSGFWERHGIGKSYYPNGNLKFSGNFVENKKFGYGMYYYCDGKLSFKGEFKGGKYDGYGEKFDLTGTLICKGHWKNGIQVKLTIKEEHLEKLYEDYEFRDHFYVGNLVDTRKEGYGEYYSKINGLKFMEGNHLNNKQTGFVKIFFQENDNHQTINFVGNKNNNEWDGPRYIYYPNGKLSSRQYCKNGQIDRDRILVEFGKNGLLSTATSYKKGNL